MAKMRVDYYISKDPMTAERPAFKYALISKPGSKPGSVRVDIMDLNPPNTPHAVPSGATETVTEDLETAFLAALARLNSHHDGLRCVPGPVED
jgi:hypothetical protein